MSKRQSCFASDAPATLKLDVTGPSARGTVAGRGEWSFTIQELNKSSPMRCGPFTIQGGSSRERAGLICLFFLAFIGLFAQIVPTHAHEGLQATTKIHAGARASSDEGASSLAAQVQLLGFERRSVAPTPELLGPPSGCVNGGSSDAAACCCGACVPVAEAVLPTSVAGRLRLARRIWPGTTVPERILPDELLRPPQG